MIQWHHFHLKIDFDNGKIQNQNQVKHLSTKSQVSWVLIEFGHAKPFHLFFDRSFFTENVANLNYQTKNVYLQQRNHQLSIG